MSDTTYELSCACGALSMTTRGEPELSLFCHCQDCRGFYGLDVLSATGWADDAVELPHADGMFNYKHPHKQMQGYGCAQCGTLMYARHKPGIPVIPHGLFRAANGGELPAALAPQMHLFYGQRVLDIDDDLPKQAGGELLGL